MNLVRWEPFNQLMSLRQAMDKLFEEAFITPSRAFGGFGVAVPIDMYQTDNEVVVKTALPGVKAEDIDITITGDTLHIRGENKVDEKIKREDYIYQEHRYGAFSRSITLPAGLDTDKAEAKFEDGVLTLTIPKSEEVKPKSIKIKAKGGKK
ncbi:MAG TPA: Hsp20/alpha crystallin family protein [Dehalococcoidia bacterium]|nr:Hsp20/alpha crystallin family protein [Dehalococcoidia bacterium]